MKTRPTGRSVTDGCSGIPSAADTAASSIRAAPVRRSSSTGSGWVRPSGKIAIAPPSQSVAVVAANSVGVPCRVRSGLLAPVYGQRADQPQEGTDEGMAEQRRVGQGMDPARQPGDQQHRIDDRVVVVGRHHQAAGRRHVLDTDHVDAPVEKDEEESHESANGRVARRARPWGRLGDEPSP